MGAKVMEVMDEAFTPFRVAPCAGTVVTVIMQPLPFCTQRCIQLGGAAASSVGPVRNMTRDACAPAGMLPITVMLHQQGLGDMRVAHEFCMQPDHCVRKRHGCHEGKPLHVTLQSSGLDARTTGLTRLFGSRPPCSCQRQTRYMQMGTTATACPHR